MTLLIKITNSSKQDLIVLFQLEWCNQFMSVLEFDTWGNSFTAQKQIFGLHSSSVIQTLPKEFIRIIAM